MATKKRLPRKTVAKKPNARPLAQKKPAELPSALPPVVPSTAAVQESESGSLLNALLVFAYVVAFIISMIGAVLFFFPNAFLSRKILDFVVNNKLLPSTYDLFGFTLYLPKFFHFPGLEESLVKTGSDTSTAAPQTTASASPGNNTSTPVTTKPTIKTTTPATTGTHSSIQVSAKNVGSITNEIGDVIDIDFFIGMILSVVLVGLIYVYDRFLKNKEYSLLFLPVAALFLYFYFQRFASIWAIIGFVVGFFIVMRLLPSVTNLSTPILEDYSMIILVFFFILIMINLVPILSVAEYTKDDLTTKVITTTSGAKQHTNGVFSSLFWSILSAVSLFVSVSLYTRYIYDRHLPGFVGLEKSAQTVISVVGSIQLLLVLYGLKGLNFWSILGLSTTMALLYTSVARRLVIFGNEDFMSKLSFNVLQIFLFCMAFIFVRYIISDSVFRSLSHVIFFFLLIGIFAVFGRNAISRRFKL